MKIKNLIAILVIVCLGAISVGQPVAAFNQDSPPISMKETIGG